MTPTFYDLNSAASYFARGDANPKAQCVNQETYERAVCFSMVDALNFFMPDQVLLDVDKIPVDKIPVEVIDQRIVAADKFEAGVDRSGDEEIWEDIGYPVGAQRPAKPESSKPLVVDEVVEKVRQNLSEEEIWEEEIWDEEIRDEVDRIEGRPDWLKNWQDWQMDRLADIVRSGDADVIAKLQNDLTMIREEHDVPPVPEEVADEGFWVPEYKDQDEEQEAADQFRALHESDPEVSEYPGFHPNIKSIAEESIAEEVDFLTVRQLEAVKARRHEGPLAPEDYDVGAGSEPKLYDQLSILIKLLEEMASTLGLIRLELVMQGAAKFNPVSDMLNPTGNNE